MSYRELIKIIGCFAIGLSAATADNTTLTKVVPKNHKKIQKDLLFPNSGLLLVQVPAFVESGKHRITIHYADGISSFPDHESVKCGNLENNTSLTGMRKYFVKHVGAALDHAGFKYTIDGIARTHLSDNTTLDSTADNVFIGNGRRSAQTPPEMKPTVMVYVQNDEFNEYEESTISPTTVEPSTVQATTEIPISNAQKLVTNQPMGESESTEEKYLQETVKILQQSNGNSTTITQIECTNVDFKLKPCLKKIDVHDKSRNHIYDLLVPQLNPIWLISLTFTNYSIFDGNTKTKHMEHAIIISHATDDMSKVLTFIITANNTISMGPMRGNMISHDDNDTFMHIPVHGEFQNMRFMITIFDPACGSDPCSNSMEFRLAALNRLPSRHERSWFFSLTTEKEVNQDIARAIKITQDWKSLSRSELDNVAKLIQQNNLAINKNNNSLGKLYQQFCAAQSISQHDLSKLAYKTQIEDSSNRLLKVVNQCSHGQLPDELDFGHIQAICNVHLNPTICKELGHHIRDIMSCESHEIKLTPNKFLVSLEITISKAWNNTKYDIFEPKTIPIFDGLYQHVIDKLQGSWVLKYQDEPSIVLLNDCKTIGTILVCKPNQSPDDKTSSCIHGILQNQTTPCFTESFKSKESCFTRSYEHGILVSTKKPLEVHVIDPSGFFRSKARQINGVSIIQNSPNKTFTVSCNGLLSTTKMMESNSIEIYEEHKWILEDTLTPLIDKGLEAKIENDQKSSEETFMKIAGNISDIENDHAIGWAETFPSIENIHGTTSLAMWIILSICAFITLVIGTLLIRRFCCRRGRSPILVTPTMPTFGNPNYHHQNTPFLQTTST